MKTIKLKGGIFTENDGTACENYAVAYYDNGIMLNNEDVMINTSNLEFMLSELVDILKYAQNMQYKKFLDVTGAGRMELLVLNLKAELKELRGNIEDYVEKTNKVNYENNTNTD